MNALIEFLREHGVMLVAGSSLLMAVGGLGVWLQRSPIQRQRLGELTMACVLAWLVLASLPLPRYLARGIDNESASLQTTDAEPSSGVRDVSIPVLYFGPNATAMERSQRIQLALDELATQPVGELAPAAGFVDPQAVADDDIRATDLAAADTSAALPSITPASASSAEYTLFSETVVPLHSSWTVGDVLPWLFLAGCAGCVAWLALGHMLLQRICHSTTPVEPWLAELYESLPLGNGQKRPRLLVTRQRGQAMSWGVLRPTIAVSAELCRPKTAQQLRHVLLHELAHIAQRDAWGATLFNAAFVVLYFHPLYWWLRARVRFAGELIADDWAVAHSSPEQYAEELISIVRRFRGGFAHLGAMTIFKSPTQFYRRMNMLLERETRLATGCPRWWMIAYGLVCVAGVGLAAAVVGVQPAGAESPPTEEQEQVEAAVDEALDGIDADVEQAVDEALGNLDETIDEAVNQAVEQALASMPSPESIAATVDMTLRNLPERLEALKAIEHDRVGLDAEEAELSQALGRVVSDLKQTQDQEVALAKPAADDEDADSAKRRDDERRAYEKQRRELEQQRRSIEEKLRALDGKRKGYDEKLKSAKRKSEDSVEKDIDRALDEKAAQQAKEAGRKAAEEGRRAAEKAMAAAKKAAEQGKEVAEKAKRKAAEKIERERRESDGAIEPKRKAADASRERELRDFDSHIERQMMEMQTQIERRLKDIDVRIERQLKEHDAQIERGAKQLAQRIPDVKRKIVTDKEEIEEGAPSNERVRELQRAKEDLGRHVKELEAANSKLTRQVHDMERALDDMKKKVRSGKDSDSQEERESPRRAKPAKPTSKSKEASADEPDSDSTAAVTTPKLTLTKGEKGLLTLTSQLVSTTLPPPAEPAGAAAAVTPPVPVTPVAPSSSAPEPAADPSAPVALKALRIAQAPRGPQVAQSEQAPQKPQAGGASIFATRIPHRDAVALANEYSEAVRNLDLALASVADVEQQVKDGKLPQKQLEQAQSEVRRAQRRTELLRTIARGELDNKKDLTPTEESVFKLILKDEPTEVASAKTDDSVANQNSSKARNASAAGKQPGAYVRASSSASDDEIELFKLSNAKAGPVEAVVINIFQGDVKTSRDDTSNTLVVRGSKETVSRVGDLIKRLDEEKSDKAGLR